MVVQVAVAWVAMEAEEDRVVVAWVAMEVEEV